MRVIVQATDELTHLGLTSFLPRHPGIRVLPKGAEDGADVLVFAVSRVTAKSIGYLRQLNSVMLLPTVLIADSIEHIDEHSLLAAVGCRVVSLVQRNETTGRQLIERIDAARNGGGEMPPDVLGKLLESIRSGQAALTGSAGGANPGRLVSREVEVIRLLADGMETRDIAHQIGCSERTIKYVIQRIIGRLNLRNRTQAVAYGLRSGLI